MYKLIIRMRNRPRPVSVLLPDLESAEHRYARYRWDNACESVELYHGGTLVKQFPEPKGADYNGR